MWSEMGKQNIFEMANSVVELEWHWLKSLEKVPKVSSITIAKHLTGCGKKEVGEKGYKFFKENYIRNVFVRLCFVKALCFWSQRKSEAPHAVMRGTWGFALLRCRCIFNAVMR